MKYNPVLVFKKQGEEQEDQDNISMKDFFNYVCRQNFKGIC